MHLQGISRFGVKAYSGRQPSLGYNYDNICSEFQEQNVCNKLQKKLHPRTRDNQSADVLQTSKAI